MRRTALAAASVLAAGGAAFALMAPSAGPPPSGPSVVEIVVVPAVGSADVATGFEHGPGRVVTVAHLIPGRSARVLVRSNASDKARPARVVDLDRRDDLAVLDLRRGRHRRGEPTGASVPLPGSNAPHLLVNRAGRAVAIEVEIRRRIQARIQPRTGAAPVRRPALELEARVRRGDSGAPLVAADGTLLGVLFASSRRHPDTAYAVAAEDAAVLE